MTLTGSCATGAYRLDRRTTGTAAGKAVDVEKSYGVSPGDSDRYGFPGHFVVNSDHENNSLYPNSGSHKMNETEISNAFETYNPYYNGENLHGPNMENYAGSTATPAGTNVSGVKTSSLIDTYYIYSFDGKLMAEYDHDGICVKEYIYMGGQLIAEYQPQTSKYYYYASDQINSTRVVLDDNADIVHSSAYGPYGQELDNITTTYEPKLKFSGKEREGYSDLDYFGGRYYDHQSFRFNSIDPIINKDEALSNPQLWNLYAYCGNNPISYLDPDGRARGDLVFFTENKKWPVHVGFDAGTHVIMFSTFQGKVVKVSLAQYLRTSPYYLLGFADITPYVDPSTFIWNIDNADVGAKSSMSAKWAGADDSAGSGTRCVDLLRYGMGYSKFNNLKKDITRDYNSNPKAYEWVNAKPSDEMFWRRNSTYVTYFRNMGLFRQKPRFAKKSGD